MKIIKACFKNYLSLLLALLLGVTGTLLACKPDVPLGAITRGWHWASGTGLEAWAETSAGKAVKGFVINLTGNITGFSAIAPKLYGVTIYGANVSWAETVNITALTAPIGRSATISLATRVVGASSNSTAAEIRQADYVCDNSTNTLAQYVLAMAAMPTAGGSIEYASGNFVASNNFTVSKPGITIRGQGYNTVATMNATGAVFYVTANNTCFENIRTDIGGITARLNVDAPRYSNVWIGSTYYETITTGPITTTSTSTSTIPTLSSTNGSFAEAIVTNLLATKIIGVASGSCNMTAGLTYVQVAHSLGLAPKHVFLTWEGASPVSQNTTECVLWWATTNATSTGFQILSKGPPNADAQIGWLAISVNFN